MSIVHDSFKCSAHYKRILPTCNSSGLANALPYDYVIYIFFLYFDMRQ